MSALNATDAPALEKWRPLRQRFAQSDLFAVSLIMLCVALIYGARLDLQPLVGEETRWATGAQEMLATGDWVVPRQQGQVFPERPPMTMWLMAIAGWARDDIDPIAVRLPSVIAVLLTSLLIYTYARMLLSRTAAFVAALVYPTFGQVLQIGRLGESEAVFALYVSASLLLWHLGYARGWRPLVVWSLGFGCTALAALVKGPQAPVYFGAIIGVYLFVQRDWRFLLQWQFAAGALLFGSILAAWQIPFYRATNWSTVVATWAGLAGDRIHLRGVLSHAVSYPVETLACLLPWSPMLIALMRRNARKILTDHHHVAIFLLTAIIIAYPTVWLATGARGRYFMPIYPLIAVLIGLLVDRCSAAALDSSLRRGWHQFVLSWALVIAVAGITVGGVGLVPNGFSQGFHQPRVFCLFFALIALLAAAMLWASYSRPALFGPSGAALAIAIMAGLVVSGAMINVNTARWFNPTDVVAEFKQLLPAGAKLASLTPIEHRFAYYYQAPITELGWPKTPNALPSDVDYFCFMRYPSDTVETRTAGRGRTWTTTAGTLPFAWEELKATSVDRQIDTKSSTIVVLGRVIRPLRAETSDATVPQHRTALRAGLPGLQRR